MRLLLVCGLCWLAASAQETDQKAEDVAASEAALADVRPRGERAARWRPPALPDEGNQVNLG